MEKGKELPIHLLQATFLISAVAKRIKNRCKEHSKQLIREEDKNAEK